MESPHRLTLPSTPASDAAVAVVRRLRTAGHSAYLVGGCVRDLLLAREPKDFDVATSARPPEVRGLFEHIVEVGAAFGVLRVHVRDQDGVVREIEVATFRAEAGYSDGRRPDEVRFTDAREDVLRRDFTINGLLCDPLDVVDGRAAVVDWVGGMADLAAHRLRAIGVPAERFAEDALRLLRAPRFAARFGLELDPETTRAVLDLAPTLARVSAERVRDELNAMLCAPTAPHALRLIAHLRLGEVLWPELATLPDGQLHAAQRLERLHAYVANRPEGHTSGHAVTTGVDLPLALAVVLDPVRDAWTPQRLADDLKLARHDIQRLRETWQIAHALPAPLPDPQTVALQPRLIRLLRTPHADAALVLLAALGWAGVQPLRILRAQTQHEAWSPRLSVTGDTLLALGHAPGPQFRAALVAAEDAQLLGASAEECLQRALLELQAP